MKQYICSICGYIYDEEKSGKWEELPTDWKCPICGADKEVFKPREEAPAAAEQLPAPEVDEAYSAMEMSVICSNLARGCEKQYMPEQAEDFRKLAGFFRGKAKSEEQPGTEKLLDLVETDLSTGYPYANAIAMEKSDRGALRALVWSEKVTRMLQSLLSRYEAEGDKMLGDAGVYVCSVCGFVYVGSAPPELCPVCKVPSWKFEKAERRTGR